MTRVGEHDGFVRVHELPTGDAARAAGASLLTSGVVSVIDEPAADGGSFGLLVLPDDVPRACELLGVSEPVLGPALIPLDQPLPVETTKWRLPRDKLPIFALGYVLVIVLVCVAVFFTVVWLLGGYDNVDPGSRRF
jgi:hypothetical protein